MIRAIVSILLLSLPASAQVTDRGAFEACSLRQAVTAAGKGVCLRLLFDPCLPAEMSQADSELEMSRKNAPLLACLQTRQDTLTIWTDEFIRENKIDPRTRQKSYAHIDADTYCTEMAASRGEWTGQRAKSEIQLCRLKITGRAYQNLFLETLHPELR